MKKTAALLAIFFAALLSACGSSQSLSSSVESSSADEKKADLYAQAALNAVEFPKMTRVETPEEIDAFFEFKTENYADFVLYMNVMSVNLNRVILVKPLDGKHDEVESELSAYLDDLIQNGAFYPAQESAAAGAVSGETKDGYFYIIVHADGETAKQAIVKAGG